MFAPVIIFVYDNAERAEQVLKSIDKCRLAESSNLYVFSDGPKNSNAVNRIKEVRRVVHDFSNNCCFASVSIIESEKNKGLADSIISGVTQIINQFDRVIVVEDDNVVSEDFLQFMNGALDYYEDNMRIGRIGGYSIPIARPKDYPYDVYACERGSSYAWATWKNRWELVDWNVSDYQEFLNDKKRQRAFNKYGEDRTDMLKAQMEGRINSWAIRYSYAMFKNNMTTIMPMLSRVKNTGDDGAGQNIAKGDARWATSIQSLERNIEFADVEERDDIVMQYVNKFKRPLSVKIKRKMKGIIYRGK